MIMSKHGNRRQLGAVLAGVVFLMAQTAMANPVYTPSTASSIPETGAMG
jgi:hypothetical protein